MRNLALAKNLVVAAIQTSRVSGVIEPMVTSAITFVTADPRCLGRRMAN
jgi:hypothetical protein